MPGSRDLVKQRRGMDDTQLEKVVDGRVFTGRQAIDLKLIDQLGDEKTAVTWLEEQKGVKKGLTVRDYKLEPRFGDLPFLKTAAAVTLEALGLGSIAHQIGQTGVVQAVDRARIGWNAGPVAAGCVELTGTRDERARELFPVRRVAGQPAFSAFVTHFHDAQPSFSVLTDHGIFTEMVIRTLPGPISR